MNKSLELTLKKINRTSNLNFIERFSIVKYANQLIERLIH